MRVVTFLPFVACALTLLAGLAVAGPPNADDVHVAPAGPPLTPEDEDFVEARVAPGNQAFSYRTKYITIVLNKNGVVVDGEYRQWKGVEGEMCLIFAQTEEVAATTHGLGGPHFKLSQTEKSIYIVFNDVDNLEMKFFADKIVSSENSVFYLFFVPTEGRNPKVTEVPLDSPEDVERLPFMLRPFIASPFSPRIGYLHVRPHPEVLAHIAEKGTFDFERWKAHLKAFREQYGFFMTEAQKRSVLEEVVSVAKAARGGIDSVDQLVALAELAIFGFASAEPYEAILQDYVAHVPMTKDDLELIKSHTLSNRRVRAAMDEDFLRRNGSGQDQPIPADWN